MTLCLTYNQLPMKRLFLTPFCLFLVFLFSCGGDDELPINPVFARNQSLLTEGIWNISNVLSVTSDPSHPFFTTNDEMYTNVYSSFFGAGYMTFEALKFNLDATERVNDTWEIIRRDGNLGTEGTWELTEDGKSILITWIPTYTDEARIDELSNDVLRLTFFGPWFFGENRPIKEMQLEWHKAP